MDVARKKEIYLLSDEVYSNYAYEPFRSVINFDYDKSILVGLVFKNIRNDWIQGWLCIF